MFDPGRYRLVQFDQVGFGRSTSSVSTPATSLATNTTARLIGDIVRLREHLGIDRWLVSGGSWGVTLGLAYAERVSEIVLASVTMTRPQDVRWLYHDVGRLFPEAWERFRDGAGGVEDLVAAYDRLLNGGSDLLAQEQAAKDWCGWEDTVLSLEEVGSPADVPWLLSRPWPAAELRLVGGGHQGSAEMTEHISAAVHRFAQI